MKEKAVYAVPVGEVASRVLTLWREIHGASPSAPSPFLHPTYVQTVGQVRHDVEVGLIEEGGRIVGFVPFQRSRLGVGTPVGSRLCDVSGGLVVEGTRWDPMELVRGAGLRALVLSNVPASSDAFAAYQLDRAGSPFLDLSGGREAYHRGRKHAGSRLAAQLGQKRRKIEREVGPLRFEWHSSEPRVFDALLGWKAAQRKATKTPNVLALPWGVELVERVRGLGGCGLTGVLSVLHAGDTVAAVHMGMHTDRVFHSWVAAYNPELSRYSPGLLLFMKILHAAVGRGLIRIDLGPGEERYKTRLATGRVHVGDAVVCANPAFQVMARDAYALWAWSRGKRMGGWLRQARRSAVRAAYSVRSRLFAPRRSR